MIKVFVDSGSSIKQYEKEKYDGICGTHDLIVHNYGPGRVYCSLHVEVPQDVDILACHEKIDDVEKRIKEELGIEAVVHMDPVAVGDQFVDEAKGIFKDILKEIDEMTDSLKPNMNQLHF